MSPTVVKAPPALLRVLTANVVRNAIQHMVSGSVSVTLKNRELQVKDTGPGVPPDIQESVNRANSSDELAFATGLGLYIIRRITDSYGWQFQLLNRKDGGTTAVIVFGESI